MHPEQYIQQHKMPHYHKLFISPLLRWVIFAFQYPACKYDIIYSIHHSR